MKARWSVKCRAVDGTEGFEETFVLRRNARRRGAELLRHSRKRALEIQAMVPDVDLPPLFYNVTIERVR